MPKPSEETRVEFLELVATLGAMPIEEAFKKTKRYISVYPELLMEPKMLDWVRSNANAIANIRDTSEVT